MSMLQMIAVVAAVWVAGAALLSGVAWLLFVRGAFEQEIKGDREW